ncbi:hypothetical protein [Marinospirillum insulare]|uniref:Uncharacterized protein n=1 Tax=Marinospirillum insulare TaxID=217169 RepID=A0ABQ5ZVJ1_9GAMM|nr:hypothetical protein [Marinospirillum insulare]GLR63043.1 hypothetical protein GCM10007878_04780 [Marinospirillum insulare]
MSIPDYTSEEFANLVASQTFCGKNAWLRLMSWLEVDKSFQGFMQDWNSKIAPYYHQENIVAAELPNINKFLVVHFESIYSAQFILRLYQLANNDIKKWIFTSLNSEQQEVLYFWDLDSKADAAKGYIADNWLSSIDNTDLNINKTPLYTSINSEIFATIGKISNLAQKRIR